MTNQRPAAIALVAMFLFLLGIVGLVPGTLILLLGMWLLAWDTAAATSAFGGTPLGASTVVIGVAAIAVGLLSLVAAYGLITLQFYGWCLSIMSILTSCSLIVFIFLKLGHSFSVITAVLISSLMLYYLLRPNVRRVFFRSISQ